MSQKVTLAPIPPSPHATPKILILDGRGGPLGGGADVG